MKLTMVSFLQPFSWQFRRTWSSSLPKLICWSEGNLTYLRQVDKVKLGKLVSWSVGQLHTAQKIDELNT